MKRFCACLLLALLLGAPLGAQGFLKGKILYFDAGNHLSEQTGSSFQFSLLGAEAQYSFAPRVRLDITRKDFREFTESKGARIQPFGYDFLAAVSYGHFGVFGIGPCNLIGQIKECVKNAILDGDIPNTFEAADALMREKAASLGLKPVK